MIKPDWCDILPILAKKLFYPNKDFCMKRVDTEHEEGKIAVLFYILMQ